MIKSHDFNSVEELLDFIAPWNDKANLEGFVFRGHSQESYKLIPTALRPDNIDKFWKECPLGRPIEQQHELLSWQINAEYTFIREFYRLADQLGLEVPISERIRKNLVQNFDFKTTAFRFEPEKWIPNDLLEVAALAQHYGIYTRLLDWTYDIYVALFFAFSGALNKDGRLAIWSINKEYLSFLKGTTSEINVDFITPHYAGNPNLNAQKGLFTSWSDVWLDGMTQAKLYLDNQYHIVNRKPLDELILDNLKTEDNIEIFRKYTLPCSEAKKGYKILIKMGYGPARIFPGYQGVADQILQNHKLYI